MTPKQFLFDWIADSLERATPSLQALVLQIHNELGTAFHAPRLVADDEIVSPSMTPLDFGDVEMTLLSHFPAFVLIFIQSHSVKEPCDDGVWISVEVHLQSGLFSLISVD